MNGMRMDGWMVDLKCMSERDGMGWEWEWEGVLKGMDGNEGF